MVSAGPRTAALLLAVVALAGTAAVGPVDAEPTALGTDAASQEANNSTVQHRDPGAVDEDGELGDLQAWLAGRLSGRLVNSTVRLERGEYERARSVLGEEFGGALSKYVEVADRTPGDGDDRVAREFEAARERQREYAEAVSDYRDTRREYRQAKQSGDERRARRLARNLSQLQRQINRTGRNLTASYGTLGNRTERNFTAGIQAVTATTRNVSTAQAEIERETFVRTAVTVAVRSESRSASFRDPAVVVGRLTAANGTALADRRIAVRAGPQTAWTRTDDRGRFEATVRPTLVGLGNRTVVAEYVPRNASVYLGANASASVNVTQVTPTVNLTRVPETARFGETVAVAGRVSADGAAARGVPVRVGVGRTVLGTARTDANGSFAFETTLPASVAAGDRRVRATVALDGKALGSATANASVAVARTATRLTVEWTATGAEAATGRDADRVRLAGTLRTATGRPVADGTVLLRVGGRTVATATANATGRYAVTVNASVLTAGGTDADAGNVTVAAAYEGSGNLRASRATATVRLGTAGGSGNPLLGSPTAVGVAVALGVVGVGALGLGLRRVGVLGAVGVPGASRRGEPGSGEDGAGPDADGASAFAPGADGDPGRAFLARADDRLATGDHDAAVRSAYAAVRREATALLDAEAGSRTHWEFYRTCRDSDALAPEQVAAVEELTEAFERARFATGDLPAEVADEAVETATEFRASAGEG